MSLRLRVTFAGAAAVLVALAIASSFIFYAVRTKLQDQVDVSLIQSAQGVASKWVVAGAKADIPPTKKAPLLFGKNAPGLFQIIPTSGARTDTRASGFPALSPLERSIARGLAPPSFTDIRLGNEPMRMYTMRLPTATNGLVRTVRSLAETSSTIDGVRQLLIALTLGGALVAGLLGFLAANAVLRPVRALAGTVREVTATRDLSQRIPVRGRDELASLADDFNAMLAALDESRKAQQQLIADASHELRTPLTAHRANLELLARPDLPAERREDVLAAAVRANEELSALVADLIQAARDGRAVDAREPLALERLVAAAVDRAQHRAPGVRFESRLEPYRVAGARSRLERAVDNVLDNAIKWSPPDGTVDVRLSHGSLTVRDRGPGIAEDDLPHVFDRFYRAADARALPGSGLGLAIVKQAVDDHGGSVTVANADGGGALVTVRFDADGRSSF